MSTGTIVLVMAAGRGTRMRSGVPKVLHEVCGRSMLAWVAGAAREGGGGRVVCVVRPGEVPAEAVPEGAETVEQAEGEGTGAAVLAARGAAGADETVIVLSGDHPLVTPELVRGLAEAHAREGAAATLLTTDQIDPTGYGRIVRAADGTVERIVETKHPENVPPEELAIREINIGAYAFAVGPLLEALEAVEPVDGERYLTAALPILRDRGLKVAAHATADTSCALGVNTRADLMAAERIARARLIDAHARAGVTFAVPDSISLDAGVEIGPDTTIEAGVTLRGATTIGAGCTIGPHTTAIDARIADGARALHSHLTECEVGERASIGPFSYLRPGAAIGAQAKIGTFVEVKGATVGAGAKIPHLSYIGDADIGEGANVAAGNVTANYDGRRKHRTEIGRGAKTGVNTSFVAPVRVGEGAYTGAGSVIVEDVPDGALGIARSKQKNVEGYTERVEQESPE